MQGQAGRPQMKNPPGYTRNDAAVAQRVRAVLDLHEKYPHLSDRQIGDRLGISRDMVFRHRTGRTKVAPSDNPTTMSQSMKLDRSGERVRFAFPKNGHPQDQTQAKEHLKVGYVYVIETIHVGSFSSKVQLREFPKEWFNTVLFEDV